MSRQSRIVYFVPERAALSGGVLNAQVFVPARFLKTQGIECFFVGAETSDARAREATVYIRKTYGIDAEVYGTFSQRIPYFSTVWTAQRVGPRAADAIRQFKPTHIYTRGFNAAPAARRLARQHQAICVFDVRGLCCEETAIKHGRGWHYRLMRNRELNEMRKADRLMCVSTHLSEWIREHTGREADVVPCCIDLAIFSFDEQARKTIRSRLGFAQEDRVVCYSGGTARWQRVDDVVRLCARAARLSKNLKFLFLCPDQQIMAEKVAAAGLSTDRFVITACEHRQVPDHLSAADAGLIMREDNPANNVASPVKVGEYLGCGLPVVLTRGIGDYSDSVPRAGVGLLLDESKDSAEQLVEYMKQQATASARDKAIQFARENVTWEAHLPTIRRIYGVTQ